DETPVLSPMEKLRTVFPNCMHVERKLNKMLKSKSDETKVQRQHLSEIELFRAFYKEVTDTEASLETETIFKEVLDELLKEERETETITSYIKRGGGRLMRPVKLTMTAFGPYKDTETINFKELDGLNIFVISGATGAGKTTIFDAICFALYGSASGTDRENIMMLRSHFANDDVHTKVEFVFEIKG